jgi:histidinol-phosphate aminotransferase
MKISIPEYISAIKPYVPGKPLEELEREYGIKDAIKLASNENPLGPSPLAAQAIRDAVGNLNRYPDGAGYELIQCIAEKFKVTPQNIVLGNGSDDIIALLTRALLQPGDEAILPQPSFLFYEISIRSAGGIPIWVPLKSFASDLDGMTQKITSRTRMIFLNVPHNPTGAIISNSDFKTFMALIPDEIVVVLDEAYIEFVSDPNCTNSLKFLSFGRAIVGMRTFSKAYGLAGLRIGYGVMPPVLTDLLNRVRQPFNVNTLAQIAAVAALKDTEFLKRTVNLVHQELDFMYNALEKIGLNYLLSQANFLMIEIGKDADEVFEDLLKQGVIVRSMASYGYPSYIRVNVGRRKENIQFLEALEKVI